MNEKISRIVGAALGLILALTAAFAGAGFLLAALYVYLAQSLPAWGAALAVAGVCFAIAFVVLLIVRARSAPRRGGAGHETPPSGDATGGGAATDLAFDLGRLGADRVRDNPKSSMAVALLAGLILGASPALRDRLLEMVNKSQR